MNAKTRAGNTPLHKAASSNNINVIQLLIDRGAEVDAKNHDGWAPLNKAVFMGYANVTELLLNNGADINLRTDGETLLHSAASLMGHADVLKVILLHLLVDNIDAFTIPKRPFFDQNEIWDLKSLALRNIFNAIPELDKDSYNVIVEWFKKYPALLNNFEKIFPYIALDLTHLKEFISLTDDAENTALEHAQKFNKQDCIKLLGAVNDAQNIDEFPDDLKIMIQENIKKLTFGLSQEKNK